jgi:hypothetical protein
MSEFEVVARKALPPPLSTPTDLFARVFLAMRLADGDRVVKVPAINAKAGMHMRKRLQEISDKECNAKTVGYRRSKDGKEFFFWLEDRP